jgi:hypothetical protein
MNATCCPARLSLELEPHRLESGQVVFGEIGGFNKALGFLIRP